MNDFVEHLANDVDEIKIFECDKHDDDDHHNRLSPLIKDDEVQPFEFTQNRITLDFFSL